MPELPEVETIRRGLEDLIVGYTVVGIESDSSKQILPSLEVVKKAVAGGVISKVDRRAKIILIIFESGKVLAVHLKLTGRLIVRKKGEPKDEWQHVIIKLQAPSSKHQKDELELRFCDARKFGWIKAVGDDGENGEDGGIGELGEYGPEPLKDLTLEKFREILSKNGRPVKIVLMDQEKISGIGNIYANDALFLAGIDPRRKANSLKDMPAGRQVSEFKSLKNAIETVLKRGLQYGGASDQYYLNAKGEKGFYQEHFLVYGKAGKPCSNRCGGVIKRIVVGGRGTFVCERCQR